MNRRIKLLTGFGLLIFLSSGTQVFAGTFSIENIHVHDQIDDIRQGIKVNEAFIPQIEVEIKVDKNAASKNLMAKAYYFDSSGQLLQTYTQPSAVDHQVSGSDIARRNTQTYKWPTTLLANKQESIYFPLPDKLPDSWTVVVVFGNSNGAVEASIPDGQGETLSYPEHDLVAKTALSPDVVINDANKAAPVIEEVVQSDNPRYPAFTLLMHLPHGVTDPKDVSGILATCLVANTVGEMRDQLNAIKPQGDSNPYYAYAEAHNLAVIAWGARWVWNSYANFDELDKNQKRSWDDDFQKLADAWDKGIQAWVDKYKIPDHNYLMYGHSAGGEWVHRLALHKPDRFLAVQMHISDSYDTPTPEGSHVLWLLTTGELDNGCDNSRRFYTTARAMGYIAPPVDLVILLNSAAPAIYAKEFIDYMKWHSVADSNKPFIVSITSDADDATKYLFPLGSVPETLFDVGSYQGSDSISFQGANEKLFFTTTPGHSPYLLSHDLVPTSGILGAFTNSHEKDLWLLRGNLQPNFFNTVSPSFPVLGKFDVVLWGDGDYAKDANQVSSPQIWTLRPTVPASNQPSWAKRYNNTTYWIVRVPKQVIADHNDVWNSNTGSLMAGIFRMAGLIPQPDPKHQVEYSSESYSLRTLTIKDLADPGNDNLTKSADYPYQELNAKGLLH